MGAKRVGGQRNVYASCVMRSDGQPATDVEEQLSWASGSALMRTQGAQSSCRRDFIRNDIAVGVIMFEKPGSEVTWHLNGNLVLNKTWSSTDASHDLIVLPPGCEFQARCHGSGQGLWLFLDPQTVMDEPQVKSFAERATVDCSWSKDRLAWMVISEIKKECANGFPRGPMFLERSAMLFMTQLTHVLENAPPRFEPTRGLSGRKLRRVVDYFEANLHRNITLSEVSDLVELTPRYFCAAFKHAMGRPPHQFQIELRVERATTLLRDPNFSLADVALMVGFSSQSHLSCYFRRIMGVTPARYRLMSDPELFSSRSTEDRAQ